MIRLITLLLFSIVLISCAKPKSYYPTIDQAELQAERQRQLDVAQENEIKDREKKELKNIEQQKRLVKVSSKILKGGVRVCNKIGVNKGGCIYEFELTKDREVNAYADGKNIYVTPAMMNFAEEDEELAIVLGHEYAHNFMGHIASKKNNMALGNILGSLIDIAASSQGVATGSAFGKIGTSVGGLKYSKEFEKEADYVGLYVTYLAGYKIENAAEFWRKMSLRDPNSIKEASTHPTNPERYIALTKTVNEIKNKKHGGLELLPNIRLEEK